MDSSDGDLIGCLEVVNHVGSSPFISVIEDVFLWVHVPFDLMNFISSVGTIISHDNSSLELSVYKVHIVAVTAFFDQCQAMIYRQELRYIVNNKIETSLEDPRRCEESRPCFYLVLEYLSLFRHKETRVATNLAES